MTFIVPEFRRSVHPGQRFFRLTVSGVPFYLPTGLKRVKVHQCVVCRCDCGTHVIVDAQAISTGNTKACGCLRKEVASARRTTHGMSHSLLYGVWQSMKERCQKPSCANYRVYGGRGISVCDAWQTPEPFISWALSSGYSEGLEIDRINNDGNYEPSNCRFVPRSVNANNKSTNIVATGFGESRTIAQWARDARCVVSYETLKRRVVSGIRLEVAISTKPRSRHERNKRAS